MGTSFCHSFVFYWCMLINTAHQQLFPKIPHFVWIWIQSNFTPLLLFQIIQEFIFVQKIEISHFNYFGGCFQHLHNEFYESYRLANDHLCPTHYWRWWDQAATAQNGSSLSVWTLRTVPWHWSAPTLPRCPPPKRPKSSTTRTCQPLSAGSPAINKSYSWVALTQEWLW